MTRNKKIGLLIIIVCGVYFIAYTFAITKTIEAHSQIENLKAAYQKNQQISIQNENLEEQNAYYDSIIKNNSISNTSLQNNILMYLNKYTKGSDAITIVQFHKEHMATIENTKVFSFIIDLKGSYKGIEKLLYDLEVTSLIKLGSLNHINLQSKKNHTRNHKDLFARIILQHYQ